MRVYDESTKRYRHCYCCRWDEAVMPSQLGANGGSSHAHRRGKRDKSRRPAKRRARREARNEIFNAMQEGA